MQTRVIQPPVLYYGTPVALLTTLNEDGSPNIAPISSTWVLNKTVVLGLGLSSQTYANLRALPELTINLPGPDLWQHVECLAPLTGRNPVPEAKRAIRFRYEPDKFGAAGLTPTASHIVSPPRIAQCPLQLEARVLDVRQSSGAKDAFAIVEAQVERVHAHASIVLSGDHIDIEKWHPLLYVFRHYFGRGEHLGKTFRATS